MHQVGILYKAPLCKISSLWRHYITNYDVISTKKFRNFLPIFFKRDLNHEENELRGRQLRNDWKKLNFQNIILVLTQLCCFCLKNADLCINLPIISFFGLSSLLLFLQLHYLSLCKFVPRSVLIRHTFVKNFTTVASLYLELWRHKNIIFFAFFANFG